MRTVSHRSCQEHSAAAASLDSPLKGNKLLFIIHHLFFQKMISDSRLIQIHCIFTTIKCVLLEAGLAVGRYKKRPSPYILSCLPIKIFCLVSKALCRSLYQMSKMISPVWGFITWFPVLCRGKVFFFLQISAWGWRNSPPSCLFVADVLTQTHLCLFR